MYIQGLVQRCFNTYTDVPLLCQVFLNSYLVVQLVFSLLNFFLLTGRPFRMGQIEEGCLPRILQLWIFLCATFPAQLQVMKAKALRRALLPFWRVGTGDLT